MTDETQKASLINLIHGGIVEMVDHELQRVADNILDPNTSETAVRTVTLVIKVKPAKDRSIADTAIAATSKLAPAAPQATRLFLGQRRGKGVFVEHNPEQQHLPLDPSKPLTAVG